MLDIRRGLARHSPAHGGGAGDRGARAVDDLGECLLKVAESGDRQAFAVLFRHYAPRIKGYLRRLGCGESEAEELAQEAMLLVWRKAALYDPAKAMVGTWIFAVARNLRISRLRREGRPEIDPGDPALVVDESPGAEEQTVARQDSELVRAALARLSPEQRDVVTLSFYEDQPHSEIARLLGVPLGTVKSRLRLAMKHFRDLMGGVT